MKKFYNKFVQKKAEQSIFGSEWRSQLSTVLDLLLCYYYVEYELL